jgi:hypothetical protein
LARKLKELTPKTKKYTNKKRMSGPSLKEGDRVYLNHKNIKTKRPNNKLDFKMLGPYLIKRKISDVVFKLQLPKNMKIHLKFYISLLEPTHPNTPLDAEGQEIENTEEYEVKGILDKRKIRNQL